VFASGTVCFGRTTLTLLACTAVGACAKVVTFPGASWELVCALLPSMSAGTSLFDLVVIFSIHFFNYAFKRKLILQDRGKTSRKHYRNTNPSLFSSLFFSSFPFLPLPSSLPVAEITEPTKRKDMLCSFTLRMGMRI